MAIHSTAVISPEAKIDPSTEIGPYVIIEGNVEIGPNNKIYPHVFVGQYTTIGSGNEIHTGAIIGDIPQDIAFDKSAKTYLKIGNNNTIREYATMHRGTAEGSETVIGNNCFIMGFSHVGHNCKVSDNVKMANLAVLSGYVEVGEGTFISGSTLTHQFVRIGRLCMIAGGARVSMDVPHFMMLHGEADVVGINKVGLQRADFTSGQISNIRAAYRTLYRSGMLFGKAVAKVKEGNNSSLVSEIIEFIEAPSKRGIAGPPNRKK